jgi:hypothetical protein
MARSAQGGKMKHFAVLGAFLLSALTIVPTAAAASLDFGGRYSLPRAEQGRGESSGHSGSLRGLEKNLGIVEPPIAAGLTTGFGRHRLSFSYYQSATEGRSFLNRSLVFNGRTFSLDEEIGSELDYDVYDFVYQYDFLDLEHVLAGFSAGVVGQVKLVDGQVTMRGAGRRSSHNFSAPIPLVGMNLHMDILGNFLAGRVRATGMGYSQGSVFDGQAELSLTPYPFLDIHGGYRFFFLDLESDDVEVEVNRSGPYLGITLSF